MNSLSAKTVEKEKILINFFSSLDSLAIAFSGGVDSSLLAVLANSYIHGKVLLINVCTQFCTEQETEFVAKLGKEYDIEIVKLDVLKHPEIHKNSPARCYHCKKLLMATIRTIAASHGIKKIADGSNLDDLSDYRPGHRAIEELGIISPFINAKITKVEIRELARKYKLENWNAAAQACLATRIPVNTPILSQDLRQIYQAEKYLHSLGFFDCRVRKLGNMAKIELLQNQVTNFSLFRESVIKAFKELGFQQITLDLEGYKQGAMNSEV